MILGAMTGHETFSDASAKVHIFSSPTTAAPMNGKEIHLGHAVRDDQRGIRQLRSENFQIAPGFRPELGSWTKAVYQVPEGAMFKVFAYVSTGWNKRTTTANLFIQMREEAAMRRLRARLTQRDRATFHHAEIEGRFDILTLDQAILEGASVQPAFRRFFSDNATRDVFEIREIEPEITTRQLREVTTVRTLEGEDVQIRRRRAGRALEF